MKVGDRVLIEWCPAHPEAMGSTGTVVACHVNLAGFGADVVEVEYRAQGRLHVMPFAPGNLAAVSHLEQVGAQLSPAMEAR